MSEPTSDPPVGPATTPLAAASEGEGTAECCQVAKGIAADLQHENERLRRALNDIVNASRDEGMAKMINWMRGRAIAALTGEDR